MGHSMNILSNNPAMIINKAANHNAMLGRTLMQLNIGGGDNKLEMMGIIKKDNNMGGPKTLMNMDGSGFAPGTGMDPKSKVSHQQIQVLLKKMFNNDDASKFGSSEFGDVSKWDQAS
jgi:hypothetical protein